MLVFSAKVQIVARVLGNHLQKQSLRAPVAFYKRMRRIDFVDEPRGVFRKLSFFKPTIVVRLFQMLELLLNPLSYVCRLGESGIRVPARRVSSLHPRPFINILKEMAVKCFQAIIRKLHGLRRNGLHPYRNDLRFKTAEVFPVSRTPIN